MFQKISPVNQIAAISRGKTVTFISLRGIRQARNNASTAKLYSVKIPSFLLDGFP